MRTQSSTILAPRVWSADWHAGPTTQTIQPNILPTLDTAFIRVNAAPPTLARGIGDATRMNLEVALCDLRLECDNQRVGWHTRAENQLVKMGSTCIGYSSAKAFCPSKISWWVNSVRSDR